jgi:hypothetical protein
LLYIDGSREERQVLTNRGVAKAIHIATRALYERLGGPALEVHARHVGPAELHDGVPVEVGIIGESLVG